jgi:hypothetical protein
MSPKAAVLTADQVRADILAPVMEEQARIKAGEQAARAAIEEAQAKREEEMTAWRAKAAECRRLFQPEPPPPEPLVMLQHHAVLHRAITARNACREWQNRLLTEQRGKAETAYRQALPELVERTRAARLGDADGLLPEWQGWLQLVKECRVADERSGGRMPLNPATARMRTVITAADLLEALKGADLLEPLPAAVDWIGGGPRDGFHQPLHGAPDGPTGQTREQAAADRRARANGGRPGW